MAYWKKSCVFGEYTLCVNLLLKYQTAYIKSIADNGYFCWCCCNLNLVNGIDSNLQINIRILISF